MFLLLPALFTALLSGCSVGGAEGAAEATGDPESQVVADEQVRSQAEDLAEDLERVAWLHEQVYFEVQVPTEDPAGGADEWEVDRELLASIRDGDEFVLVVRIRAHLTPGNTSDWDQRDPATVARCFRFVVPSETRDIAPEDADCPDGDPIAIPIGVDVPPSPTVTERDRRAIRRWLASGATAADVDDLTARLSPHLRATAADVEGATGVAVSARPAGDDCAVGRRDPSGRVDVWHPPAIQTAPGEYGCVPLLAIDPPAAPH